jgi:bacillopeptidase F (M6 metalloprotease family)
LGQKIKKLLMQLRIDELYDLAKERNFKLPEKWKKSEIIDFLSHNITEKEIDQILRKKKEIPQLKGSKLEKKVMEKFSEEGFTVRSNVRMKGFAEFDIIGWKDVGFLRKRREWIFVECKNKDRVTPEDWKKFLGNFMTFKKKEEIDDEDMTAYLITTGLFHPEIKKESKKYPNVIIKRIRL